MKKIVIRPLAILITFCLILVTGCGGSKTAGNLGKNNAAPGEKAITVLATEEINPEIASPINTSNAVFQLYELVYEPLVRYGEGGTIEPGLAESWTVSEDGTSYTFHLRRDVKFSDGTAFNADSVVENTKRWNTKVFSTPLTSVDKIDEYTVVLTFAENCYPVLIELSYPRPYRIAGSNAFVNGEFVKMIGTGPWMLDSFVAGEEAVFVPNPEYYGEKPKLDRITLRTVTDGQSRIMALQSGEADLALTDLPAEGAQIVKDSDSLDYLLRKGTMGFYFMFNQKNETFKDENVRKALNYALDKDSIANKVFLGTVLPAKGVLPETVPYVTGNNSPGYSYDLAKAKQLLTAAGYEDSNGDGILEKDGKPLSLKLVFQTEEYTIWKTLCEFVQAEMKKAGVDIQLDLRDSSAYYDAIWKNRDFDLIIYRTYEDSWNPHGFLRSLFYQPKGSAAISWYDPELNTMLDEVLLLQNEGERQQKYNEIFSLMHAKAICLPVCYPVKQYAYNTRLTGLETASTSYEAVHWQKIDIAQ